MKNYRIKVSNREFIVKAQDKVDAVKKLKDSILVRDANTITFNEYKDVKRSIPPFGDATVHFDDYQGNVEVVVSWTSLGGKSPSEARKFVNELQNAIKYAEKLESKYSGFKIENK